MSTLTIRLPDTKHQRLKAFASRDVADSAQPADRRIRSELESKSGQNIASVGKTQVAPHALITIRRLDAPPSGDGVV